MFDLNVVFGYERVDTFKALSKRCLYLAKEHDVEVGSTLGREHVIISVIQILKVIASWYYNVTSWPLHHEIRSHRHVQAVIVSNVTQGS